MADAIPRPATSVPKVRVATRPVVDLAEPSAGKLAHGVAKSSDIQRVRRQLGAAELRAARALAAEAARLRREAARIMRACSQVDD